MFSFPYVKAYDIYRAAVKHDPERIAMTKLREETAWFVKYEKTFIRPVARA